MSTPLWCLVVGAFIPYLCAFASFPFRKSEFGTVDVEEPRAQGERLTGAGGRAWAAQTNAWEALAVFTVANFVAHAAQVDPQGSWTTAALIWVVARILHTVFYVRGVASLRVLAFGTGIAMSTWIVVLAATG